LSIVTAFRAAKKARRCFATLRSVAIALAGATTAGAAALLIRRVCAAFSSRVAVERIATRVATACAAEAHASAATINVAAGFSKRAAAFRIDGTVSFALGAGKLGACRHGCPADKATEQAFQYTPAGGSLRQRTRQGVETFIVHALLLV
jgi:hypothetical protein